MCEPITAMTAATKVLVGLTVASTAVQQIGAYQSAKAQTRAINEQNEIQAKEIADAASVEMNERARAARRERGAMRARGAESGISLGSNSFMSFLQTSAFNQYNDQGTIIRNESNQQRARDANYRSGLSRIQVPTALSSALAIGSAGYGAYSSAAAATRAGQQSVT